MYLMHKFLTELSRDELKVFKKLNSPIKIQDFLESIPANFEEGGGTLYSPRNVLAHRKAHCFEGALFASAVLLYHGHKPLLLDLQPTLTSKDDGHALALFKEHGLWGAISKTNHVSVRYRDPVYRTVRELVMSYFHEYFLDDGIKNLRSYAMLNLETIKKNWIIDPENVWYVEEIFNHKKYTNLLPNKKIKLRKAEQVEINASKNTVWKKK